jgi:hypothetical protein
VDERAADAHLDARATHGRPADGDALANRHTAANRGAHHADRHAAPARSADAGATAGRAAAGRITALRGDADVDA